MIHLLNYSYVIQALLHIHGIKYENDKNGCIDLTPGNLWSLNRCVQTRMFDEMIQIVIVHNRWLMLIEVTLKMNWKLKNNKNRICIDNLVIFEILKTIKIHRARRVQFDSDLFSIIHQFPLDPWNAPEGKVLQWTGGINNFRRISRYEE